jgi:GABA permease
MRRVLIVANQTLGGTELQREIADRMESGPCEFWVLVPATPTSDQIVPTGLTPEDGTAVAETRLDKELTRLGELGVTAAGEIGDPDPIEAIRATMAARDFDEIILATLPQGVSRWLRQDLVHRVQRKFPHKVTHVVSAAAT